MAKIILALATQNSYDSLSIKSDNMVYICTDSHNIYFGMELIFYEDRFKRLIVDTLEITADGLEGTETIQLYSYNTTTELVEAIEGVSEFAYL